MNDQENDRFNNIIDSKKTEHLLSNMPVRNSSSIQPLPPQSVPSAQSNMNKPPPMQLNMNGMMNKVHTPSNDNVNLPLPPASHRSRAGSNHNMQMNNNNAAQDYAAQAK